MRASLNQSVINNKKQMITKTNYKIDERIMTLIEIIESTDETSYDFDYEFYIEGTSFYCLVKFQFDSFDTSIINDEIYEVKKNTKSVLLDMLISIENMQITFYDSPPIEIECEEIKKEIEGYILNKISYYL